MGKILEAALGKPRGISESDLQQQLGALSEYAGIEAKGFVMLSTLSDQAREDNIIAPVVAMLNRTGRSGLVFLGIDAPKQVFQSFSPPANHLFDETILRSWLNQYVAAIPSTSLPGIEIHPVPLAGGQFVYIVECKARDESATYYSTWSDTIYDRKIDTEYKLSLLESIDLLERRACAQVYVGQPYNKDGDQKYVAGTGKFGYFLYWGNAGNRPGREVLSLISVKVSKGKPSVELKGDHISKLEPEGRFTIAAFQARTGNGTLPLVYPNQPVRLGLLEITCDHEFVIHLEIKTMEEKGYTTKDYFIDHHSGGSSVGEDENARGYYPFIGTH